MNLQLAVLRQEPWFARLRDQVKGIAGLLQDKASIPMIQAELPLTNGQPAITFDATGRCDTGTVRFVGHGSEVAVTCDTPIETYRVVKDEGGRS